MAMAIRVRHDHRAYRSWRAWRGRLDARIAIAVHREFCATCWGNGFIVYPVAARDPRDMSRTDPRRGFLMSVLCETCGGRRVIETVVDVEG